ncbi:MAG TPA: aspartate dehydrogenase [Roseiarcus sp.]
MVDDESRSLRKPVRVAVVGLGAVGLRVVEALSAGVPGCELAAIVVRDRTKAAKQLSLNRPVPLLSLEDIEPHADIVVECAPAHMLPDIVAPFLRAGKTAIVLSASAILSNYYLVDIARANGGQIVVPTGALLGLDAVTAAAEGTIHSVRMTTRKPVAGLMGAPYLVDRNISFGEIVEPLCVFRGTPREAAVGFPANLNVAAALSLAGIGPDRTTLEIWADPSLDRNIHTIEVESDSARFSMTIENIPTDNPKTSRIAALSVVSYLRKIGAPLRIGS